MNEPNIIIGTGEIGSFLINQHPNYFKHQVNSSNINSVDKSIKYNEIWVVAPSGSKEVVASNPKKDLFNIKAIAQLIHKLKYRKVILITPNDCYDAVKPYGRNRLYLEDLLVGYVNHYRLFIFRLAMPIEIKRGLPYDYQQQHFEKYTEGVFQFYSLGMVFTAVHRSISHDIHFDYLSSEPVGVNEILRMLHKPTFTSSVKTIYNFPKEFTEFIPKEEILKLLQNYIES